MDMHSCAGRPFVPCVLRTRLHGIVNDDKFVAGATLAKRKMVAVTTVHREGIGKLDPMGARVELSPNQVKLLHGDHQVRNLPTRSTPQQEQSLRPCRGEGKVASRSRSPRGSRRRPDSR